MSILTHLNEWLEMKKSTLISDYEIGYIKQLVPVELYLFLLRCLKNDELCKMHGIVLHGRKSGVRTRIQLVREELTCSNQNKCRSCWSDL